MNIMMQICKKYVYRTKYCVFEMLFQLYSSLFNSDILDSEKPSNKIHLNHMF